MENRIFKDEQAAEMAAEAQRVAANADARAQSCAAGFYDGGWRYADADELASAWYDLESDDFFAAQPFDRENAPTRVEDFPEAEQRFFREVVGWLAFFEIAEGGETLA